MKNTVLCISPRAFCRIGYRRSFAAAVVAAILCGVGSVQAAIFFNVANTGTGSPDGGTFSTFSGYPSISGNTISFYAETSQGRGIFTGTATSVPGLSAIVRAGDPAPEPGYVFSDFGLYPSISGANVAFSGSYSGGNGFGTGIYTSAAAGSTPNLIADFYTPIPGQSQGNFNSFTSPTLSGNTLAFQATFYSNSQNTGIYKAGPGGVERIADTTQLAPGHGNFTDFGGNSPAVSGGNVAFRGLYDGGQGIYTSLVGGSGYSLMADNTTAVPGQTGKFVYVGNPALSGTNVAFYGSTNNRIGVYVGTAGQPGSLTRVADTTTAAPGHGLFSNFDPSVSISGSNVAFYGNFSAGGSGLFVEIAGNLIDVINVGDPLFGSTLAYVNVSSIGYDGNYLTFGYRLDSGVNGEAAVALVPEPTTWLAGGLTLLLGGTLARRRQLAGGA